MARTSSVRVSITGDDSDLKRAVTRSETSLDRLNSAGRKMGAGLKAGALVGGAALVGLAEGAHKSVEAVEELGASTIKFSRITGASAKTSSEWVEQAKVRGIETQKLNTAFLAYSKQITAAASGTKASVQAFKELGVSQKIVKSGDFDKTIGAISDGFAKLPNGAEKAALAQKLFGKQAQLLMPLLQDGSDALQEQLGIADKYGATIGDKTVAQVKKSAEEQRNLKLAFEGLKITIGTALLPVVDKVIKTFAELVTGLKTGQGQFGALHAIVKTTARVFAVAFAAIGTAVSTVKAAITGFVTKNRADIDSFLKAIRNVATVVGHVFNDVLLPVIRRVLPGIKTVFDGIITAIRGAVRIISGVLTLNFGKAWDGVKDIFASAVKIVVGIVRAATAPIRAAAAAIGRGLTTALGGAFGAVKSGFSAMVQFLKNRLADVLWVFQKILEGASHLPLVGGKFKKAAEGIQRMRDELHGVNSEASRTPGLLQQVIDNAQTLASTPITAPTGPRGPQYRGATGGRVPGAPVAADSVHALLSPREFVVTGDGERILETMTFPGVLNWLQGTQLPHFAAGGRVGYGAGYSAGVEGKSHVGLLGSVLDYVGEPHKHKTKPQAPSASGAGVPADQAAVRAMLSRATSIAARGLPYIYGGGHGGFSTSLGGYDCSGYVSNILGPGVLPYPAAVVSPMNSMLSRGVGRYVTVGMRGSSGQNAHTMMRIGNQYFESGGGHGPARVGGWDGAFSMYHPRGLRTGGRVGNILGSIGHSGIKGIREQLKKLAALLPDVGGYAGLLSGIHQARADAKDETGGQRKGLLGAAQLLEGEYGRRLGVVVHGVTSEQDGFDRSDTNLDNRLILRGLDPEAGAGKAIVTTHERGQLATMRQQRKKLERALQRAKRTGNKGLVRKISRQIRSVDDAILQQRADVKQLAAPDPVDAETGSGEDPNQPLIDALITNSELIQAQVDQAKEATDAQKADTDLRARIFGTQTGQVMAAIADMVSGQIGGRVGLGVQTPGFAGGGTRY